MKNPLNKIRQSISFNLFFWMATIMFVSQTITVFWLWHESKEQIDVLVNLTLSQNIVTKAVKQEEFEAILVLLISSLSMILLTVFLTYLAIKWITRPLVLLEQDLIKRTEENLNPIKPLSHMREIESVTTVLNNLFARLNNSLIQERLFTADVAHEMRTPLAGIRLHLELLESKHHIDCRELIERIDRLVKTVEQLLMLARASQKFTVGQYQKINFNKDIKLPLLHELNELASLKNQQIIWQVDDDEITFNGDTTLIKLLLRNLIENSHRYSPSNTIITIRYYQKNQHIYIEVLDQGPGVEESQSENLVQAFFQMDRKHEGTGLGLNIVNRIANLHHATFSLKNRQDNMGAISQLIIK